MIEKRCPHCGEVQPARVTRTDADCTEWECPCGGRWVVKAGQPGEAFAFYPPDIAGAFDDNLEPFFAGS